MTMLDRILYALASPLAREIIDSLERDPGAWRADSAGLFLTHANEITVATYRCIFWGMGHWRGRTIEFWPTSRLALRRAIRKWEKNDG